MVLKVSTKTNQQSFVYTYVKTVDELEVLCRNYRNSDYFKTENDPKVNSCSNGVDQLRKEIE